MSQNQLYPQSSAATANALIKDVAEFGRLAVRGTQALLLLREAIAKLQLSMGVSVVFDPRSEPRLRDYLAVGTANAAQGAAIGGLLGLFIGLLVERPSAGLMVGLGVGTAAGAARGVSRVNDGWRLFVHWDAAGEPLALIETHSSRNG